jgi:hypothetical protein
VRVHLLMTSLPCMQEVPPTEPVEEGDEGEWDTVGEPAGSRRLAPTVEELIAQLERQPPARQESIEPAAPPSKRWWPQEHGRALRRLPLLQRRQRLQRRRSRRPPRVDW